MNRQPREDFKLDAWTREEWDRQANSFASNSIYQLWDYGEMHSFGRSRSVMRAGLMEGDHPLVLGQMRIKTLPLLPAGVAELEWAPLFREREDLDRFLKSLQSEVVQGLGYEVRVYPKSSFEEGVDHSIRETFQANGFDWVETDRPYQTAILNLEPELDALHSNLRSSWRRQLRKAQSSGLTLEEGSTVDYFDRFSGVYDKMWESKQFITGVRHPIIRGIVENGESEETFRITLAIWNGEDVAASVSVQAGNSLLYFLGASAPGLRNDCQPGYLLHWNNVIRAKEANLKWYDLGGLVDDGEGVNRFKRGMNGREVVFPGCFVAGGDRLAQRFYHTAETAARGLRHLVKGR